jgi:hypothetical protein
MFHVLILLTYIHFQIAMYCLSLGRAVLSAGHRPSTWTTGPPSTEVLRELHPSNKEFDDVKCKILHTLRVPVHQVFRVENPYLYGEYMMLTSLPAC